MFSIYVLNVAVLILTTNFLTLEAYETKGSCVGDWTKMNTNLVCFEGKGNRFGSFHNYVRAGLVGAIKLEHVTGHIRCATDKVHNSHWGCANHSSLTSNPFNAVLTDQHNHVIFPKKKYIGYAPSIWYWVPFADTVTSKELIFTDFAQPFFFPKYKQMRVWYGEDLTGITEPDNYGRVCVNVYAKFMN